MKKKNAKVIAKVVVLTPECDGGYDYTGYDSLEEYEEEGCPENGDIVVTIYTDGTTESQILEKQGFVYKAVK